jgi:DNA-binding response OmpR family regulator
LLDADGYTLLVTDVHMPGQLDGIALAERAQQHRPALPVVFISGRPDVFARLRSTGIKGMALPKPFPLSKLVAAVTLLAGATNG